MATKKLRPKINGHQASKGRSDTTVGPPPTSDGAPQQPDLTARELYINRELSLLAFQRRVLQEAEDPANPLLERVKFLAIVGSNIDEFFMVRVSGLLEQTNAGILDVGPDGMSPGAQLVTIRREVKKLASEAQRCLTDQLLPELREAGIQILEPR
jgi:polyphosphate kinase